MRARGTEREFEPRLPGLDPSGFGLLGALAGELDRASASREQLTIGEARRFLEAHCLEAEIFAGGSSVRFFLVWGRLERYATSSGVDRVSAVDALLVRAFVSARTSRGMQPSLATKHLRRAAVRTFFRLLREFGLSDLDPTLDLGLPARQYDVVRALTDKEIERGRWASASIHRTASGNPRLVICR